MGTYTAKTRTVGRRPRSKRLRELGGTVTISNGGQPDLSPYELLSNKVTEVDQNSTDEQYPTAKLLYDLYAALGALIDALDEGKQDAISDLAAIRSGAALGATALQAITAAAGSDIGTVGTPSVTVSTQGSSTTLTFHQLKGAKGDKGDTGATGPQGPAGAGATVDSALSDSSTNPVQNKVVKAALDGKAASSHTHSYLPLSGGILTGPIGYQGSKASYNMIKFKDNAADTYGNGIVIGGGGLVVIGGGEAADSVAATHSSGGDEVLDLCSDGAVVIWTNVQNGATNSAVKKFTFTENGDIVTNNPAAALGTPAAPFHHLVLGGATSATMGATTDNPRITFVEGTGIQPVNLVYCDYDSYRAPAGLKVVGDSSKSSSPAWFEVEGKIYAAGGTISDQAITANKSVVEINAVCTAASGSNVKAYGLKVSLSPTQHGLGTDSAAIYASATAGYAGMFSGGVKVSATLTANRVDATGVYQTSDDRLKDYLGDFHFNLADLDRIPLRFFAFKADKERRVLLGTSAQAVQKVLPEIVGSSPTASEEDTEEYLSVDYSKLALVALDCVRQLRDEVAALRREVEQLKKERRR